MHEKYLELKKINYYIEHNINYKQLFDLKFDCFEIDQIIGTIDAHLDLLKVQYKETEEEKKNLKAQEIQLKYKKYSLVEKLFRIQKADKSLLDIYQKSTCLSNRVDEIKVLSNELENKTLDLMQ